MAAAKDLKLDGVGPIYEQIRRAIAEKIRFGAWQPDERIPAEVDLMAALNVSRMTVHRALAALARDGLLERRRGAGSFVSRPATPHAVLTIPDIAEEIRAAGASYGYRLLERAVASSSDQERHALELAETCPVLRLSCLHSASGVPFVLEERVINLEAVPSAKGESFGSVAPGSWLLARVLWSSAEHTIGAAAANPNQARRLQLELRAPLLMVERRTFSKGAVVTWVRLAYPAAAHRFRAHFSPGS